MPVGGAVTVTLTVGEVLPPGFGLLTATANVPAVGAEPVAVSWLAETNLVVTAAPPNSTCAPGTKLLPAIVSVYAPAVKLGGLTLLIAGVGFHSVTLLVPLAAEFAAAVALMLIVLEVGRLAGAVYIPAAVIVPVLALPPATPFTNQFTVWSDAPVTVALKGCAAPARTFAEPGRMLTDTCSGVGALVYAVPAHPTVSATISPSTNQ